MLFNPDVISTRICWSYLHFILSVYRDLILWKASYLFEANHQLR